MVLSIGGMLIAFGGALPPVSGALFQEVIDLGAVLNALRASVAGGELSDYPEVQPQQDRLRNRTHRSGTSPPQPPPAC